MILPIQCFGNNCDPNHIFPSEEYHIRSNKFMFSQFLYSILIKNPNYYLFIKSPDLFLIKAGDNSLKFTRKFVITDEYERNEIHTEIGFPINNFSEITLKLPYGFKFNCFSEDMSIQVSDKCFCFSRIDQSLENYKYYLFFSIGEEISFISQVQYSTKTLLSTFYNDGQLMLVHSMHPFTPKLLISSCLKMKTLGHFDFFQKIKYKSDKNKFSLGLFSIFKSLEIFHLRYSTIGVYLIKKFKYLTAGVEFISNRPTVYFNFNFSKVSPIILTDIKRTSIGLRFNFTENRNLTLSFSKFRNDNKIGFSIRYICDN